MAEPISTLATAVMRAVVATGVMTEARVAAAVEIMRAELKDFIAADRYADARACVMTGSLNERYVVGLIVAECVTKISAIPPKLRAADRKYEKARRKTVGLGLAAKVEALRQAKEIRRAAYAAILEES